MHKVKLNLFNDQPCKYVVASSMFERDSSNNARKTYLGKKEETMFSGWKFSFCFMSCFHSLSHSFIVVCHKVMTSRSLLYVPFPWEPFACASFLLSPNEYARTRSSLRLAVMFIHGLSSYILWEWVSFSSLLPFNAKMFVYFFPLLFFLCSTCSLLKVKG